MTRNLLYRRMVTINDNIGVYVPRVREILKCEDDYYSLITIIEFEIPFDDVFKIKNVDDLKNYVTDRDKLTEGDLRNLCKLLKKINHTKPLSIITNGLKNRCRKILKRNKID